LPWRQGISVAGENDLEHMVVDCKVGGL
jgi:hypothetical protein